MSPRYDDYDFYRPSRPIQTDEGLKARSQRGPIGQSWWAGRWIAAMERLVDPGRLRRGRSYARSGQVLSIEEKGGVVTAQVQGTRPRPYLVTLRIKPLTDEQWEAAIDQMAGQAIFAAQLLAGEMPPDIEEAFSAAGISLFPDRAGDLVADCSCPDYATPCKHAAATHYILGEQFDEDPFMLFRLRGRAQEQILAALRARRSAEAGVAEAEPEYNLETQAPEVMPLEKTLGDFWQPAIPLEQLVSPVKQPAVDLPLLKRLGPPAFLPDQDLTQLLGPAYEAITRAALRAAYGGSDENVNGQQGD